MKIIIIIIMMILAVGMVLWRFKQPKKINTTNGSKLTIGSCKMSEPYKIGILSTPSLSTGTNNIYISVEPVANNIK